MRESMRSICIIGIDTDIGKTLITGLLARSAMRYKIDVATMKPVQTGCKVLSDDIAEHRHIMGIELQPYDVSGLSCPYLLEKPCSPALAAELEDCEIKIPVIGEALYKLERESELVLIEGAGGLMVPLNRQKTFLDVLVELALPVILVTNNKLGSINHTLLSLEVLKQKNVTVLGLVYNCHFNSDEEITRNTREVFSQALENYGYRNIVAEITTIEKDRAEIQLDIAKFIDVSQS